MRPCSQRKNGYTLIEVLVAFVILAMALTVLFRIFSTGLRNVEIASEYTQAVLVGEAQLDSSGLSEPLVPGRTQGVTAHRFSWTRTVTSLEADDHYPSVRAFRIHVAVEWPAMRGSRRVEFATVRLSGAAADDSGGFR